MSRLSVVPLVLSSALLSACAPQSRPRAAPVAPSGDAPVAGAGHVVDEATPAAYGDALDPGLYVFPDGLRVHFVKGGMWVTTLQSCTYHETFWATAASGGGYGEEFVAVSPTKSAFAFSRVFDLRAGKLVVSL